MKHLFKVFAILCLVLFAKTQCICASNERSADSLDRIAAPRPLFDDPVYHGPTDPMVCYNPVRQSYLMYYTQRPAAKAGLGWIESVHGSEIGVAESKDGGVSWEYIGTCDIDYHPDEQITYWAPEVICHRDTFHMYLTYVPGVFNDWKHPRDIVHLTSLDGMHWKYQSVLPLTTHKVIDACIWQMPDGVWRLWYNNEPDNKGIYYAESSDLYHWTDKGSAHLPEARGEGPNVFFWKGKYYMIVDEWKGLSVYSSNDALKWDKQKSYLLPVPKGSPTYPNHHADVEVVDGHAYMFYFTHLMPKEGLTAWENNLLKRQCMVYVTELELDADGQVTCDETKPCYINLMADKTPRQTWTIPVRQMADSLSANLQEWKVPDKIYKVEKFGAKGDGKSLCTKAIQNAIDKCSAKGGGVVSLSKGDYVSGTLVLKSNVMLRIDKGSRLLGSTDLNDYPEHIERLKSVMSEMHKYRQSLIYAEGATNIGICGEGEIDFRGERKNFSSPEIIGGIDGRPFGMRVIQSSNIVVKDVTLRNAAAWMQNYLDCRNLILDGITVRNLQNYNNDGIDIDGCSDVIVRRCDVVAEDDAICFKGASGKPTENILVEDCKALSTCNALKIGTDTQGDFRNIMVRRVTLGGFGEADRGMSFQNRNDCSTGITLETVDGGNVENIIIEDVSICDSRCPVYVYLGDRMRVWDNADAKPGYLRNVIISDVTGKDNGIQGSLITGIPDHEVENVTIRNFSVGMAGGGVERLRTRNVPLRTKYPDAQSYCRDGLPAYGFFVRHANNVHLDNINVTPGKEDAREMIVLKD